MNNLQDTHPELAAQLVNPALASALSAGSGKKVEWRCPLDPRHVWTASVYSRKNGNGCSVCNGKTIIAGVNDLATTHPELAAQLVNPALASSIGAGSKTKPLWQCGKDARHVWPASVSNRVQGRGCPVCSNRLVLPGVNDIGTTHPALADELKDQSLRLKICAGTTTSVEWRCSRNPLHIWSTKVVERTNGNGCPFCSGRRVFAGATDLATTHPSLAAQLVRPEDGQKYGKGSDTKLEWLCPEGHVWIASVYNRVAGNECSVCANQLVVPGVNDLATTRPEVAAQLVDPSLARTVTAGSKTVALWQCTQVPEHRWYAPCYRITGPNPTGCPSCFSSQPSSAEADLAATIALLMPDETILTSHVGALGDRRELDIYIPSRNFAVEFNGLYWHSTDNGRTVRYHADKTRDAAAFGIRLIHVWEDDWRDRREVVIRALAHRLGATSRLAALFPEIDPLASQTVYARKLMLGEVTGAEAKAFLGANHIQGATTLTRKLVLRDDEGRIRALLGLRSPQNNARMKRGPGDWEIQRYATLGNIPGGFSKLLKYAERMLVTEGLQLDRWVSFAANDISTGGLYEQNGFVAERTIAPDYKYVGNYTGWTRKPKETFQRRHFRKNDALLWDESWTEREAARQNGLFRVYDAGKTFWVKTVR